MRLIGLTGGIGVGKSTVSEYLKSKGVKIIDADKISRELTAPNGEALPKIKEVFGDVFYKNGTLNRKKLGEIVFSDYSKKKQLEDIVSLRVIEIINEKIRQLSDFDGIVVLDAPLLFEFSLHKIVQESWLIVADMEIRMKRIKQRDNLLEAEIMKRINSQMPDSEKRKLCTHVIDNSYSLDYLYKQLKDLI